MSASLDVKLSFIHEPDLLLGSGQRLVSPKDGLYLFGPLREDAAVGSLRLGLIGTANGIERFRKWLGRVAGFMPAKDSMSPQHRPFPGFAAVFGLSMPAVPTHVVEITNEEIDSALLISDRHVALFQTVSLFADAIERHHTEEESVVDLWFVVVPERVYLYGRPKSVVPIDLRRPTSQLMNKRLATALRDTPSLFAEDNVAAEPYRYERHFHNQLKARLLAGAHRPVVQVVRETTIAPDDFTKADGRPLRLLQDPATVAWNLCTTTYFKSGRRPWRLAEVRPGVCYVGLVFKRLPTGDEASACCGAQMFLDSGDGLVFKGAVGPWRARTSKQFHLSRESARTLLALVVDAYTAREGHPPTELFIHGRAEFNDDEWIGFLSAAPTGTTVIGVRIRSLNTLKLYRPGPHPVLRGTAALISDRSGYLWTRGFIPYLNTYPGRETPTALRIDLDRGDADLLAVMKDVLALTKLNFNACIYGDGLPVTLRFADQVGEILTAGPETISQPPLPFKYYI